MKKLAILVVLVLSLTCIFAGCDSDGNSKPKEHTHEYSSAYEHDEEGHWQKCTVKGCKDTTLKTNHQWIMDTSSSTEATCTDVSHKDYACVCGLRKHIDGTDKIAHTFSAEPVKETVDDPDNSCKHELVVTRTCDSCHKKIEFKRETVYSHSYGVSITTTAKCHTQGVKTYTCSNCGESYTNNYADESAHVWNDGTLDGNITTYACTEKGCSATKQVVSFKNEVKAENVSTETLKEAGAIELKNATIEFDDRTLDSLGDSLSVSADEVKVEDLNVEQKVKDALSDAPVYDFSLSSGEGQISSFAGYITVTLPYTLSEGENPDNVAVYYIKDDGTIETVKAIYSNGSVSFTTTHFSIYAVIKMTPEEACAFYGHILNTMENHQETCTQTGWSLSLCSRCGEYKMRTTPMLEHVWVRVETVLATNEREGYTVDECNVCHKQNVTILERSSSEGYLGKTFGLLTGITDGEGWILKASGANGEEMAIFVKMSADGTYYIAEQINYGAIACITNDAELTNGSAMLVYTVYNGRYNRRYYDNDDVMNSSMSGIAPVISALTFIKTSAVKLMSSVPVSLQNIIDRIAEGVSEKLFEKGYGNEVNISSTKLALIADNMAKSTISELSDFLCGEGTFDKVKGLIDVVYTGKVSDLVAYVNGLGVNTDDLFNFVSLVAEMAGMRDADNNPVDFGALVAGKKDEPAIDMFSKDTQIPSYADMKKQLGAIAEMNVYSLFESLQKGEKKLSADEIRKTVDKYIETIENASPISLTVNNGKLTGISCNVNLSGALGSGAVNYNMSLTVADVDEYIEDFKQNYVDKIDEFYNAFALTKDNYKWLFSGNKRFKAEDFTCVTDDKGNVIRLISKDFTAEEPSPKTGTYTAHYDIDVSRILEGNFVELADAKGIYALYLDTTLYYDGETAKNSVDVKLVYDDNYTVGASVTTVLGMKVFYDSGTGKHYSVAHNYYGYFYGDKLHCFDVERITKEEYFDYFDNANYGVSVPSGVKYYYKLTCKNCGEVNYEASRDGRFEKEIVNPFIYDNPQAILDYCFVVRNAINYDGTDGSTFEYINQYIGGYYEPYSETIELDGGIVIDYKVTEESPCVYKSTFTLKIDGKVHGTYVYTYDGNHLIKDDASYTLVKDEYDACHYFRKYHCTKCNKDVLENCYDYKHSWKEKVYLRPTQTQRGLVIAECSACGESVWREEYCEHAFVDDASGNHTCNKCGYTYQGDEMPSVMLEILSGDYGYDYSIGFRMTDYLYDDDFYMMFDEFLRNYHVTLAVYDYTTESIVSDSITTDGVNIDIVRATTDYEKYDVDYAVINLDMSAINEVYSGYSDGNYGIMLVLVDGNGTSYLYRIV